MIKHIDFESDCKRIAKEIQKDANNPTSDAILLGKTEVIVSESLIKYFNQYRKSSKVHEWEAEINKHLKGCRVKYDTLGYGHGWFLIFYIEYE